MERHTQLQAKLRRSSSYKPEDLYPDYMLYAKDCRDELDVYNFMEENNIGIDQPQFWLHKLRIHQKRCQFKLIASLLKKIKLNYVITSHADYPKLVQFQEDILCTLRKLIRSKAMGRRKVQQFQFTSTTWSAIHKKKRKVGTIQIYIDEDCRQNYKLQDFSEFVQQNLKTHCQLQRNSYLYKQQSKPLSFLGQKTKRIEDWFQQNKRKSIRNTAFQRKSNRFSIFTNKHSQNPQILQTPNNKLNLSLTKSKKGVKRDFTQQKSIKKSNKCDISDCSILKEKMRHQIFIKDNIVLNQNIDIKMKQTLFQIQGSNTQLNFDFDQKINQNDATILNFQNQSQFSQESQSFFNLVLSMEIKQAQIQIREQITQTQTFETIDSNKENEGFEPDFNSRIYKQSRQKLKILDYQDFTSLNNCSSTQLSSEQLYADLLKFQNQSIKLKNQFMTNKKKKNTVEIQKKTNSQRHGNKHLSLISQEKSFFYSQKNKYNQQKN